MFVKYILSFDLVTANDKTIQEFLKPHTPVGEENNDNTFVESRNSREKCSKGAVTSTLVQNRYTADDSAVPISQTSTLNDRLFEGKVIHFNTLILVEFKEVNRKIRSEHMQG